MKGTIKRLSRALTAGLLALLLAAVTTACGSDNSAEIDYALNKAEEALAAQDYEKALKLCNDLSDKMEGEDFTATQYCRMASVYGEIYAADNGQIENITDVMHRSADALKKAYAKDSDSVVVYMSRLSPERLMALQNPSQLINSTRTDMSTCTDGADDTTPIPADRDLDPDAPHQH